MKRSYFKIQIISNKTSIPIIARFIADAVIPLGVTEKRAFMICFFIESALEIRLSQIDANNPYVEVELSTDNDLIYISILDKGLPYVFTEYQKSIMKKGFVDGYRLEQLGKEGQRGVFTFKTDQMLDIDLPKAEEETILDFNITERRTRIEENDINELIKCLYSAYGYTYLHQSLYRTEEVKKVLASGKYVSMLSENEHGQILGHIALSESDDMEGMFEYCNLITKPSARGHRVAGRLSDFLVKTLGEIDAEGCFVEAICAHSATQKLSAASGFTPSGFVFHCIPPWAAGDLGKDGVRLDLALFVMIKDKTKLHKLYIPEEIKDFVVSVYESEKLPYELPAPQDPAGESVMTIDVDSYGRSVKAMLNSCGEDISEKLERFMMSGSLQSIEIYSIYLNINDCGAVRAFEELHKRGFVTTGVIPGSKNGDYLVLQKLTSPHDRSKIILIDECDKLYDRIKEMNGGCLRV